MGRGATTETGAWGFRIAGRRFARYTPAPRDRAREVPILAIGAGGLAYGPESVTIRGDSAPQQNRR
jgi:hypothetical protein